MKANNDSPLGRIRNELKVTLSELSRLTNIPVATLSSVEYGRRNLTPVVLERLQAAFPKGSINLENGQISVRPEIRENSSMSGLRETLFIQSETEAMAKIYQVLRPFKKEVRERIFKWVLERLDIEEEDPKNGN